MKRVILLLTFSLFVLPLTANAASVSITNLTTSGGGTIVNGNGVLSATANHNDIAGAFSDTWDVNIEPTGSIFSLATSNFFSDFTVEYSLDNVNFFLYNGITEVAGLFSIQDLTLDSISAFKLRISGTLNGRFRSGGYNVSVEAVPVPAAAWLFGSAILGLAGLKTRRKTVTA